MYLGSVTIERIIDDPESEGEKTTKEETWSAYGTISRYYPATRDSPAEGGEIEVEEMISGEDSTTLSFDDFMKIEVEGNFTEDSILSNLTEQALENAKEAEADARWEANRDDD